MQINQETFEAWLLAQDPEDEFNYMDTDNCLCCRFIKTITNKVPSAGPCYFYLKGEKLAFSIPDFIFNPLEIGRLNGRKQGSASCYSFKYIQQAYLECYPNAFAITDGTSRGDCSHLTGDIVVVTPAHNRETQPLMQNI